MTPLDTIAPWSKSIVDLAAYGLIVTDTDLVVREWSPWMEQHSGVRAAQAVGRPLFELFPDLERRQLAERYQQALNGQVSVLSQRLHGYLLPMPAPQGQALFEHMQQATRIGPLSSSDEVVGTITIIEDVTERVIAETELKRLLAVEQAGRLAADRARRRADFLAEASVTLSANDDYHAAITQVVRMTVPDLADWCAVNLLAPDGETIELLAFASIDQQLNASVRALRERYPMRLTDRHGVAKVLRTGEREFLPVVPDDFMLAGARDDDHVTILRTITLESYLCVPLRLGQRVLGALTWASRLPGHHYSPDDLALAEELAYRIALAIDRVQRYAAEQAARRAAEAAHERMEFLANLGEQLAATLDYQETLHTLARLTVPQIADWCIVHELDEQCQPQAAIIVANDPEQTTRIAQIQQAHLANPDHKDAVALQVIRKGEPVLIAKQAEPWPAAAGDPGDEQQPGQLNPRSIMSVPLQARGRTLGALTFVVDTGERSYGPQDLTLAIELGRRAALALDNAQLYRAAQAALERSDEARALLDALISSAPVGLAFLDRDLRYVRVNPLLAEINGQPAEQHLGRSIPEMLPDLAPVLEPLFSHVLASGEPLLDVEVVGHTAASPDDERAWQERIYPVYTSGGDLMGIGAIVLEVTERKRAEQQIRRANERLKLALDAVNGFIYDYDLQTRSVERSAEFVKVTGYWPDEVPGSSGWWIEQIHPDDREQVLHRANLGRTHEDYHSIEYRVRHKDGHYIHLWDRAMVLRNLAGQAVRLVGSTIDVSERRQAELEREQLLAREQHARQIAETTAERISRLQAVTAALSESLTPEQVADVMIQHGNMALGATNGWFAQLGDDEHALDLVSASGLAPDEVEHWRTIPLDARLPLAEAVRTGHSIWVESLAEREQRFPEAARSDPRPGTWVALPLSASGRTIGAVGFQLGEFRAIEAEDRNFLFGLAQQCAQALERARLYDAERRALAAAQEAIRMRDIFFSVASHELRTPLTALLGQAQLLQRRLQAEDEPNPRNLRSVQVIGEQSLRLNRMVGAMLDVSRIETGQLSIARAPVELVLLTRRMLDEIVPMLPDHTIETELSEEPLLLDGDELRLEQVLHNLINNAAKYSPEGGVVRVRVLRDGDHALISVADHGIGIPIDAQQRLFERFYRAGNAQELNIKGMGIGLYLVNEIIGLHRGQISVLSAEGQGSTFSIRLPLRPD